MDCKTAIQGQVGSERNWDIMAKTHGERIASLETVYTEIVKPIREDLRAIKETVQRIDLRMPEIERRVLEHHDFMKDSKAAGCPRSKNNPGINSNREHRERKTDQPRYKYIFWSAMATGTAGIISTILLLLFK
ncbi:hypothetical protein LCGC14_2287780 [marine sediment metagenome]|uniref:Uncharacterized protein n=1 Tax=marine sediment metagenome TaxID=412755 RepID=A0A0F9DEP2_9ZZZZ